MIDDKEQLSPVKLNLKELVDHYEGFLKECERKSSDTRATYQRALREFLKWFPVDRRFMFRVRDVERYRRHLAERRHLANVSIATYMTSLRRFCQYLIDIGVLKGNPAKRVLGGSRPEKHSRAFLTAEELTTLLETVDRTTIQGMRDFSIIRIMLGCALSGRECILADIGDIRRRSDGKRVIVVQGKGRTTKDETVVLPDETHDAIEEYLTRRFSADDRAERLPLFASMSNRTQGHRMTTRGIREVVNRWLRDSGVKKNRDHRLTPFSLRHTAGMLMVDSGASIEEVMRRMRIQWRPTATLYFKLRGKPVTSEASPTTEKPRE